MSVPSSMPLQSGCSFGDCGQYDKLSSHYQRHHLGLRQHCLPQGPGAEARMLKDADALYFLLGKRLVGIADCNTWYGHRFRQLFGPSGWPAEAVALFCFLAAHMPPNVATQLKGFGDVSEGRPSLSFSLGCSLFL